MSRSDIRELLWLSVGCLTAFDCCCLGRYTMVAVVFLRTGP